VRVQLLHALLKAQKDQKVIQATHRRTPRCGPTSLLRPRQRIQSCKAAALAPRRARPAHHRGCAAGVAAASGFHTDLSGYAALGARRRRQYAGFGGVSGGCGEALTLRPEGKRRTRDAWSARTSLRLERRHLVGVLTLGDVRCGLRWVFERYLEGQGSGGAHDQVPSLCRRLGLRARCEWRLTGARRGGGVCVGGWLMTAC